MADRIAHLRGNSLALVVLDIPDGVHLNKTQIIKIDSNASLPTIVIIILVIIAFIILLVVFAVPTGYIQKVEAQITLTDNNRIPQISDYEFKEHDFTYSDWWLHESQKLEIVSPKYKLEFSICDIPPSTDCDKDQATFNWGGNDLTITLTAPTFIGTREFTIRLTDVKFDIVIEEIVEWQRF